MTKKKSPEEVAKMSESRLLAYTYTCALYRLREEYKDRFKELLKEERDKVKLVPAFRGKGRVKLTPKQKERRRARVKKLRDEGLSYDQIAAKLKISHALAWNIDHERD